MCYNLQHLQKPLRLHINARYHRRTPTSVRTMVKFYDSIPDDLAEWALAQQVFFTASAPLTGKHINISPKGLPSSTFSIFDGNHAAYVDATGSGCETISHVYENGRITIMFCSFAKAPRIMRFFCMGSVVEWDNPRFEPLLRRMGKERIDGARAVILLDVYQAQTSCGFGVPLLMNSHGSEGSAGPDEKQPVLLDRDTLGHWASKQVESNTLLEYQAKWNASSLDGCPGMRAAIRDHGGVVWLALVKARGRKLAAQKEALGVGIVLGMVFLFGLQMLRIVPHL
ncbi:hypothetical protein N7G274_002896 [Stereocaulon virgatum]|uniref:Pyridoxamine phosphate oxidase family protein n=1 Tax=Stereocaulon virgatum TaxID=373712 RepID=A0ABR4AH83_9LECA